MEADVERDQAAARKKKEERGEKTIGMVLGVPGVLGLLASPRHQNNEWDGIPLGHWETAMHLDCPGGDFSALRQGSPLGSLVLQGNLSRGDETMKSSMTL